jgi:hypothetical protein
VRELRSSTAVVATILPTFVSVGLVQRSSDEDRYRYGAAPETAEIVGRLDAVYRQYPNAVLRAILDSGDERLRHFSDAFRITRNTGDRGK